MPSNCAQNNMLTKICTFNCFACILFYRRHRPRRHTTANFRENKSKRESLFTMQEILANNSVSVSEVCISEGSDVTMTLSTSSSRQQISETSDVYYLLDDDNNNDT